MVAVRFINQEGEETALDGTSGETARDLAIDFEVDGILGSCGGACMCATCHVYVEEAWLNKLPAVKPEEDAMLANTVSERRPNSRLSCQIELTDALDGLTLHLPEDQ